MKLSQYNYSFSPDMLAKYPAESRDESRLMVLNRRTGKIEHKVFKEMIDYFRQGDVLVFNDTKVFPALPRTLTAALFCSLSEKGVVAKSYSIQPVFNCNRRFVQLKKPAHKCVPTSTKG